MLSMFGATARPAIAGNYSAEIAAERSGEAPLTKPCQERRRCTKGKDLSLLIIQATEEFVGVQHFDGAKPDSAASR